MNELLSELFSSKVRAAVLGHMLPRPQVALSLTEGEDKPLKYPVMFRKADLVVLTKADLLPHLPHLRLEVLVDALGRVMPDPKVLMVSAPTGDGLEGWLDWLVQARQRVTAATPARA